jgi:UDP-N-acetylglucosamine--N-acetylmuramyl-(pentapeptide) pyrophosphoryl-undecaprenol N-acetylglucosamine transferase
MPTLLVATVGGHLVELADIARRLPDNGDDIRVWVTQDHMQSRSLLAHEPNVVYVPDVQPRDVAGIARNLPYAHRLMRRWNFNRVISTGSATALAYLPYLALRGAQTHYIDSATRIDGDSETAKVLKRLPRMHMYTQWPHLADDSRHYGGAVFDGFTGETREGTQRIERVVVTLGTMATPFRSLLDALIPILGPGGELERRVGAPIEVLWQTGKTPAEGLPIDAQPMIPGADLEAAIGHADVVVGHAGVGSSLTSLIAGKYPVLVPRRASAGEIVDDHQLLFAEELERRDIALRQTPDAISVDDLLLAATRRVTRAGAPEPFRLVA